MNHTERLTTRPVFLLGMPRSGTTWLSQIFESSPDFLVRLSPTYSYPLKNQIDHDASRDAWVAHLSAAICTDDPFMTQNWRRDTGELGRFQARSLDDVKRLAVKDTRFHALYQIAMNLFAEAKLLYVVRHPAGALNSWWRSREFPKDAVFAQEWRNGACRKHGPGEYWGFDDWRSLTTAYLELEQRDPGRYRVFSYEALVRDPETVTGELFRFVGCELPDSTIEFLRASHSRHDERHYAVYKDPSVAYRWRTELPEVYRESIQAELAGTALARFAT